MPSVAYHVDPSHGCIIFDMCLNKSAMNMLFSYDVLQRLVRDLSYCMWLTRLSSRCSIHRYRTGRTTNVRTVDEINPPMTTVANGR